MMSDSGFEVGQIVYIPNKYAEVKEVKIEILMEHSSGWVCYYDEGLDALGQIDCSDVCKTEEEAIEASNVLTDKYMSELEYSVSLLEEMLDHDIEERITRLK